jgi:hypothetical protein
MASVKTDYQEVLSQRISQLHQQKLQQEEDLKLGFNEFTDTLNPIMILKKSLHEMVDDRALKNDLVKAGLHLGAHFLIGRIWKKQTVRSYLSSVVVENLSDTLIQNGTASAIISSLAERATTSFLKS